MEYQLVKWVSWPAIWRIFQEVSHRGEVVKGHFGFDADGICHQLVAQKRQLHGGFFKVVVNRLAEITRTDPIIDGIVIPCAGVAQHLGNMRFPKA